MSKRRICSSLSDFLAHFIALLHSVPHFVLQWWASLLPTLALTGRRRRHRVSRILVPVNRDTLLC